MRLKIYARFCGFTKMLVGILVVTWGMMIVGCPVNRIAVSANNENSQAVKQDQPVALENDPDVSKNKMPNYVGCWKGMRGGRIKITADTIADLGSNEESGYVERSVVQRLPTGIQTGEEYLLEADRDFPESFLAKFIRLSFNSDETVGFITYDSYEEYVQDKLVGQGLFERTNCS